MGTLLITRKESFCAGHRLLNPKLSKEENLALYHKCTNYHGHNYELYISVMGDPNPESGLLIEFEELKTIIIESIIDKVDHQFLNDLDDFKDIPPTVENMVQIFWEWLTPNLPEGLLHEIKLSETGKNSVTLRN